MHLHSVARDCSFLLLLSHTRLCVHQNKWHLCRHHVFRAELECLIWQPRVSFASGSRVGVLEIGFSLGPGLQIFHWHKYCGLNKMLASDKWRRRRWVVMKNVVFWCQFTDMILLTGNVDLVTHKSEENILDFDHYQNSIGFIDFCLSRWPRLCRFWQIETLLMECGVPHCDSAV